MDEPVIWLGFGMVFGGQLGWRIGSHQALAWLSQHDDTFVAPSAASRFFLGGLFTSFGPMSRYRQHPEAPGHWSLAFWGGFGVSMLGLVVLLGGLASL